MATTNYRFDKRQRELRKNKKHEEKRLKKLAKSAAANPAASTHDGGEAQPAGEPSTTSEQTS